MSRSQFSFAEEVAAQARKRNSRLVETLPLERRNEWRNQQALARQTTHNPPPPVETTEQDISTLRGDTGSDSDSDNEWRDSVTFDGYEWMIASGDYEAKTGDKKKRYRTTGSTGRYILRDGQPIFFVNHTVTAGRTKNVFPKGNKLRIKNKKLEYKNEGQRNRIDKIVWDVERLDGKDWNVGVGQ